MSDYQTEAEPKAWADGHAPGAVPAVQLAAQYNDGCQKHAAEHERAHDPHIANLNGDVQAKHPDWVPVSCPNCGRKCWKMPEADKLKEAQGVELLCTCGSSGAACRPV